MLVNNAGRFWEHRKENEHRIAGFKRDYVNRAMTLSDVMRRHGLTNAQQTHRAAWRLGLPPERKRRPEKSGGDRQQTSLLCAIKRVQFAVEHLSDALRTLERTCCD